MFPFFASNDDVEALLEISTIYGKKAMIELAKKLSELSQNLIRYIKAHPATK